MAKKKNKLNFKFLYLVACVLGIVAVCMIFLQAVKIPDIKTGYGTVEIETGYTGLQVVFGNKVEGVSELLFSFMALLPYLLMIGGVVLSALKITGKGKNGILDFVSIGLFVAAGVLMFITPSFVVFADTVLGKTAALIEYKLSIGAILAGIFSILAGATIAVKNLLKK